MLSEVTRNPGATYFIPSENEWYKAAYFDPLLNGGSGGYWSYATQSNTAPDNSLSLAATDSNDANYYKIFQTDLTNHLTPVGTFSASPSYYGTFDQTGDVFNWNETADLADSLRGARGGCWYPNDAGLISSANRGYDFPTDDNDLFGFRIASVPEPGSIALLLAGAVGLLAVARLWRKRQALGVATESR